MIAVAERRGVAAAVAALLLGAALATPPNAAATTSDPQSVLLDGRRALQRGDAEAAAGLVAELRAMLGADPRWDPDGSFARSLLPDLDRRIARMRDAIAQLDALAGRLREVGDSTEAPADPVDPAGDLQRAEARVSWVMEELERIAATIPDGPDRGALVLSQGYTNAVDLIAERVLPELAAAVRARFGALDRDDERLRAVKARMDSLKREIIDGTAERERLERRLAEVREDQNAYREVLIEFIGDDPATADEPASQGLQGIGLALARRIREVWVEVRKLERQSPADRARLLHEIECLRLANQASIADGSRDLGARIDALAVAIDDVPVTAAKGSDQLAGATGCMAALRP